MALRRNLYFFLEQRGVELLIRISHRIRVGRSAERITDHINRAMGCATSEL